MISYDETDIVVIATNEYKHHPKANLIDFYKLFFQSYYGQGHFISNEIISKRRLECELIRMNSSYYPYIQDISNRKGLYRISLDTIKKRIVTLDDYLVMFLNESDNLIVWEEWSENWEKIKKLLLRLYPNLIQDAVLNLCKNIIDNKAMTSHSDGFRLTYNPHYRVMQLSEFEMLKFQALREYL